MGDREIRSDSKLKGDALTDEQHQELWDLRYPAGETEPMSLEDIAATEVPRICSVTCAVSTLSDYYKWARRRKRIKDARQSAEEAKVELLTKEPDTSEEQLERYGQLVFMNEAIETLDAKTFGMLKRLKIAEIKVENDSRKIALLERKAEFADEVKKAAENREGGVTAEEMEEIERRLKLM